MVRVKLPKCPNCGTPMHPYGVRELNAVLFFLCPRCHYVVGANHVKFTKSSLEVEL